MEEITRYLYTQTGYDLNQFMRWAIRDPETLTAMGCCPANLDPLESNACTCPEPSSGRSTTPARSDRPRLTVAAACAPRPRVVGAKPRTR